MIKLLRMISLCISLMLYIGSNGTIAYGAWEIVNSPDVNSGWNLSSIHFPSSNEGWTVGYDYHEGKGVLLHYLNGNWAAVYPPDAGSSWDLSSVHFPSSNEGWAVGYDYSGGKGVLLRYLDGNWTAIYPPDVSPNWWLSSVHFPSSNEGWAVGYDYSGGKGVLLRYLNGNWTAIYPPDVSTDWWLSSVYFTSSTEGWAVGHNWEGNGILLRYTGEALSAPSLVGPTRGTVGASYVYSIESFALIAGHGIEYLFEWGDGTYSEWSPTTSAPKSWSATDTYTVKAKARCAVHTTVESDWSESLTVTITSNPVPDLTGQWTSLGQSCKTTRSRVKCNISGRLNIRNVGSLNAPSSFVRFYLSSDNVYNQGTDTFLKQVATGCLRTEKSETRTLSYNFPMGETASGKYIIAVIDADNTVVEADESNNYLVFGPVPAIP